RIGTVLRTRDNVKPLFISAGHKVSLDFAEELVMQCGGGYRLPEPTRIADKEVTRLRKELFG
ncbi:MAG: endonuclease V, partial [bacterium]|nr:endonuclease V [bacterium]